MKLRFAHTTTLYLNTYAITNLLRIILRGQQRALCSDIWRTVHILKSGASFCRQAALDQSQLGSLSWAKPHTFPPKPLSPQFCKVQKKKRGENTVIFRNSFLEKVFTECFTRCISYSTKRERMILIKRGRLNKTEALRYGFDGKSFSLVESPHSLSQSFVPVSQPSVAVRGAFSAQKAHNRLKSVSVW